MNYNENQKKALGDIDQVVERLATLDSINSFLFEDVQVEISGQMVTRKRDILTPGEKICLSQERACLREYRDFLLGNLDEKHVRYYIVPLPIEMKLWQCLKLMKSTNWTRKVEQIEVNNPQTL